MAKQGGGSRAAKKRAKKKQQQLARQQQSQNESGAPDEIIEDENMPAAKKEDTKLLELPMGDDSDDDNGIYEMSSDVKKDKQSKKRNNVENTVDGDNSAEKNIAKKARMKKEIVEKEIEKSEDVSAEIVENDDNHNDSEDEASEEQLIKHFLGGLSPAEIIVSKDDEEEENSQENLDSAESSDEQPLQQPDPYELVQTIPAKMRANLLFSAILSPSGISPEQFYAEYWEKKPLLISTNKNIAENDEDGDGVPSQASSDSLARGKYSKRFEGILTKKDIEELISSRPMRYGKDLNVTNYCNTGDGSGKHRITLDQLPEANTVKKGESEQAELIIAESNDVWSNFDNGCSVRLLCPQQHCDRVHKMLSILEDEFGCMVGANAYLTPGGGTNQGFAPHYDDIEAFIIQLEGYKHWRVYEPRNKRETLPRESSTDFTEEQMKDVDPVIDVELGPGDLLYMPRGWIHQANTCRRDHHSLHLTASAMQNWAWVDLLEMIMPEALEAVAESDKTVSLRTGLPRNFLSYMGTMHEESDAQELPEGLKQLASKEKENGINDNQSDDKISKEVKRLQAVFKADAKKKIMRICKQAMSMITVGCDQIGKRFLSDRLPPFFTQAETELTSEYRTENGGKVWPNTMVRLAKPGIARLVVEGDKAVLYHSADNSRVYHEHPLSPMEFEIDDAPALETLLTTIEPHWVCVRDLIHGDIEDKMDLAQTLYDEGILAIFQEEMPDRSVQTG